jgi:hypothetical protein
LLSIKACCLENVEIGASMKAESHATEARIRARASGPDTSTDRPASASASRCAARALHFASRALSESRLSITWLRSLARSAEGSCSTCCASTSAGADNKFLRLRQSKLATTPSVTASSYWPNRRPFKSVV